MSTHPALTPVFPMIRYTPILVTLLLLLLPSPAARGQDYDTGRGEVVTLRAGDVIRIIIWREEDLSGEFPVERDGVVVLPLLGERHVTGIPMHQLRDTLIADYRVHLRNPSISVTPLRRINVLGEVNKPGLYTVDPTISLAGAVAVAGGTTSAGDLGRIRIIRSGRVLRERVDAGTTLHSVDVLSGDQIIVEQRSWFERNTTFVVSLLLSVTGIVINLLQ